MNTKMISTIRKDIHTFLDNIDKEEDLPIVSKLYEETISILLPKLSKLFKIELSKNFSVEVETKVIEEITSTNNGLKYQDNQLILSEWVIDTTPKHRKFLFYFLLIKACFLYLFRREFTDFDHYIVNILAYLFVKELENLTTINNSFQVVLNQYIYPDQISGRSYQILLSLQNLLHTHEISSKTLFEFYKNDDNPDSEQRVTLFSRWVTNLTVKTEDVIAPIYINWKLVNVLEQLLKEGYEGSTTKEISKILKTSGNTVRVYFDGLTSSFNTFWRVVINFQKLNLHNYYIKVVGNDIKYLEEISTKLLEIPYLKTLYLGRSSETNILYSPTLICPHTTSDNLSRLLRTYKDKKLIDNYSVQLIRRKVHFGTVTSYPYKATMKNFESFINEENEKLIKHTFADEQRDFSTEFKYYSEPLDYNLLYFFSILKGRNLVKGNFTVWQNELTQLYEKNNLINSEISEKTLFLTQIESRTKRRNLLSFSLFMMNFNRKGADILLTEIPFEDYSQEKEINEVIEKLRVFSLLGQITLYDSIVLTIPGGNHQHPIRELIENTFKKSEINPNFYTVNIKKSRFIPYQDLYDFENGSWKNF